MQRYTIKINILGSEFNITTDANSDSEAKDMVWFLVRENLAIEKMEKEPIEGISKATKIKNSIKEMFLL